MMSGLSDVLAAVREVIVMNERVTALTQRVDKLEIGYEQLRDRVTRMEVFSDVVRPILGRTLPAPDGS